MLEPKTTMERRMGRLGRNDDEAAVSGLRSVVKHAILAGAACVLRIALIGASFALFSASPPIAAAQSNERVEERPSDGESLAEKEADSDDHVPIYIEELFLGRIIYPQEKDEVQVTGGYFHGVDAADDTVTFCEIEYGITDELQIGLEAPSEFVAEESWEGVRNLEFGVYYNFYSNRETGAAYGVGCDFGAPIDAAEGESRTCVYEPFVVAYHDFNGTAVNLSAALEIEDPLISGEATETTGDVTLAAFRRVGALGAILEANVEIGSTTPVRLAPALYWRALDMPLDFAVSLPVGLNRDAPEVGVFFLALFEFDLHEALR